MGAFITGAVKLLTPAFKWIGLNVLIPWLKDIAVTLYTKFKKKKAANERAEQAEQANTRYEEKPSDETFGDSP